MNETPFNLGKQAAYAGCSIHANPYPCDSKEYEAWKDGFWVGINSQIIK
jgi:hypothetical protein